MLRGAPSGPKYRPSPLTRGLARVAEGPPLARSLREELYLQQWQFLGACRACTFN